MMLMIGTPFAIPPFGVGELTAMHDISWSCVHFKQEIRLRAI